MVLRKTYDTRVKYLVMKGLLPDLYRRQIHKSLISKWRKESPHGQLFGLIPAEAYGRKTVNFKKIREKMIDAHHKRISYNQTHACLGCPFGCKQN